MISKRLDILRAMGAESAKQIRKEASMSKYAKAIVAALGSLLLVLNTVAHDFGSFLPPTYSTILNVAIGVLTVVTTYAVPNKPAVAKP